MSDLSSISGFSSGFSEFFSEKDSSTEKSSDHESEQDFGFLDSVKTSKKTPVRAKRGKDKVRYVYAPGPGEPELRISPKRMTTYEYAAIIGSRAEMISRGSPVHPLFQKSNEHDLLKIAEMELNNRDIPFPLNIYRPIDNPSFGSVIEVFNPHESGFYTPTELLTIGIEEYRKLNLWRVS